MKPLFFFMFILSVAISTQAQKFELGLNGGIGYNSAFRLTNSDGRTEEFNPIKNYPVAALKVVFNHHNWQYGLSLDYRQVKERYYHEPMMTFFSQFLFGPSVVEPTSYTHNSVIFPARLFVNRKIVLNHFELYYGISAGYICSANNLGSYNLDEDSFTPDHTLHSGYSVGIQTGCTWYMTRHWGLNAEACADRIHINTPQESFNVYSYPLTAGIRYRI